MDDEMAAVMPENLEIMREKIGYKLARLAGSDDDNSVRAAIVLGIKYSMGTSRQPTEEVSDEDIEIAQLKYEILCNIWGMAKK